MLVALNMIFHVSNQFRSAFCRPLTPQMGMMLGLYLNCKLEKASWCLSLKVGSSIKPAFSLKSIIKLDFGKN